MNTGLNSKRERCQESIEKTTIWKVKEREKSKAEKNNLIKRELQRLEKGDKTRRKDIKKENITLLDRFWMKDGTLVKEVDLERSCRAKLWVRRPANKWRQMSVSISSLSAWKSALKILPNPRNVKKFRALESILLDQVVFWRHFFTWTSLCRLGGRYLLAEWASRYIL